MQIFTMSGHFRLPRWLLASIIPTLFMPVLFSSWVRSQSPVSPPAWRQKPAATSRMNQRLEEAAGKLSEGNELNWMSLIDIAYPPDKAGYFNSGGNGLIYLAVVSRIPEDLAAIQLQVTAEGKSTVLDQIQAVFSCAADSNNLVVKKFGAYRMDALYLFPVQLRLQPGELVLSMAGKNVNLKSFRPPWPAEITSLVAASKRQGGPSELYMDQFIRREFPGVLDENTVPRTKPASVEELAAITARGRKLFAYDRAAWQATDALMAAQVEKTGMNCYLAVEKEDGWAVIFGQVNDRRDAFLAVCEARQQPNTAGYTITRHDPPHEETGFLLSAALALNTSRADFRACHRTYNHAVLPAEQGQFYVYMLPARTEAGIFPLGADVRYLISADGLTIMEKRVMHRVLNFFQLAEDASPGPWMHTAVLDGLPEDSDVFHVLDRSPSIPEWVVTPRYAYNIKTDGTISYVMTSEAFNKILGKLD